MPHWKYMTEKINKGDKNKTRLDSLIIDRGLVKSRHRARAIIMAGKVLIDDRPIDKPGTLVSTQASIILKEDNNPFVSRGGLKLEKALQTIPVSVKGLTCLDIGASTGGFTDCLIQYGASKVYAVDVGYGQFDWTLRQDSRIVVIERTNIRYMPYEMINEKVDLIVADTSFISLKIVIPSAEKFMKEDTLILALIKPQFEAGKKNLGKGGVVKDEGVREMVIEDIKKFFQERGYRINLVVPSPILGPKGNMEYILSLNYK
jgi:23S rRNA (cytidine1920-2'-O)/16S rRNA (cytidine1409-2'-O)-methyltransferase